MRKLCIALTVASIVGLATTTTWAEEGMKAQEAGTYDSCQEQLYDPVDEPCGGGHQHIPGKRDEASLDLSRHRHRYLEERIRQLNEKVDKLVEEVAQLKKAQAK